MKAWQEIAQRVVVSDQWLTLKAVTYRLASGLEISPYYVLEEKAWVHVVALHDDGGVATVRQYRPAGGVTCIELPGGIVQDGEAIAAAARRELREETGLRAREMTLVGSLWANPSRQTNKVHVFLARGLELDGEQRLDESEDIQCGRATFDELFALAASGAFGQLMHVGSLALARAHLDRQRK